MLICYNTSYVYSKKLMEASDLKHNQILSHRFVLIKKVPNSLQHCVFPFLQGVPWPFLLQRPWNNASAMGNMKYFRTEENLVVFEIKKRLPYLEFLGLAAMYLVCLLPWVFCNRPSDLSTLHLLQHKFENKKWFTPSFIRYRL